MRSIVYARVSTDAQERDGTSLDTQERACLQFARERGWHIVEVIRDTASGYTLDRSGMERVRRLIREGACNVVLSYAVDRLARNQTKLAVLLDEVDEAGVALECVTEKVEDSPLGKLVMSLRAFAAEVEREKITERTTRGKMERARSGRIPQATGGGCYGYTYNPAVGRREVEPYQSTIVGRIFQRYVESRSMSAVARELNHEGVPSFTGGRWSRQVVHGILTNESYVGRFVYRKTRSERIRDGSQGRRKRRSVQRPAEEWIQVDGASPPIIDESLWQRVHDILSDPERTNHRPPAQHYELRGRGRCATCRATLLGQTFTNKGRKYRYYRCRNLYAKDTSRPCKGQYIPANRLEAAVWNEVVRVLSEPAVVLAELERGAPAKPDPQEIARIEHDLAHLREREKRLVRLFTYGEIDEALIRDEGAQVKRERQALEAQLAAMRPPSMDRGRTTDITSLENLCSAVRHWLEQADDEGRRLALEALQVTVTATARQATVAGVLPSEAPAFIGMTASSP